MRAARKSERGLTLVETLVAMAILFIVFLGLTDAGLLMLDYNINNTIRDEAVSVAEESMEAARTTPFAALATLPTDNVTRPIRNLNFRYGVTRTVAPLPSGEAAQVTIDVTWSRKGRDFSHRAQTLVRNR